MSDVLDDKEAIMESIIWGNYKGGVGKTTSVFQVATYFAQQGKKVLLIDLDPQCSLSNICCSSNRNKQLSDYGPNEVFNYAIEVYTRYINAKADFDLQLLLDSVESPLRGKLSSMCIKLRKQEFNNNLFFIPSSISYENCRINELAEHMQMNVYNIFLLYLFKKDLEEEFDYIFIDCPPTSNILIQSAFLMSDYYIVPTIIDEVSTKGVADYISEIEKTYFRYDMNPKIGSILLKKVYKEKARLIGVFETIYKERRGNADNSAEIISLDKNISSITGVKSLISEDKFLTRRYQKKDNGFETENIFKYYIGHRDNRSNGESIPNNTARGEQTQSYEELANAILSIIT